MTNYDRASVVVGGILVGIVLLLVLDVPPRVFQFTPLGTPLTLQITGSWAVSTLLVGLACAGTEAIVRTHPSVRGGLIRHTFPSWILPSLTTMAIAAYLPRSPDLPSWLFGLVIGGSLLAWSIFMNYRVLGGGEQRIPRTALRLSAYPLALVLFTAIYRTRLRSLVTATAVTLVAFLLALSILLDREPPERPMGRMFLYCAIIGLMLGETIWALNYWQANALTVGVLLMLLFYVLTGIVREHIRGSATRQVLFEFLIVAALGIWIVVRLGPG
jgi:hypothetical protein